MIDDQTGYLLTTAKVLKTAARDTRLTPVYRDSFFLTDYLKLVDEMHG